MNITKEGYKLVAEVPTEGEAADKVKENFGVRLGSKISSIKIFRPINQKNKGD